MASEKTEEANSAPALVAKSSGAKPREDVKTVGAPRPEQAELGDGVRGAEPSKPQLKSHRDFDKPPDNEKQNRALDRQAEGGFLSWFKARFTSFLSNVSTTDAGVNTRAGARPRIDTSGRADPNRAKAQHRDGQRQVDAKQAETARAISANPGQSRIEPVEVNETKQVTLPQAAAESVDTPKQDDMAAYAAMPLPKSVRTAADAKMQPLLDKSLSKPRQEARAAAQKRNREKQQTISKAQKDADALNRQADREQRSSVAAYRQKVADEQNKGLKEAQDKVNDFNSEADKEQRASNRLIQDRIKQDQGGATKKLADAEKEAQSIKEQGERDARAKKRELKRASKKRSWWDRAVSAVKSAVKSITKAIDGIFNWVRKKVKQVIDAAKKAALDLIEAGRKWIIDKLDRFGQWLKDKVNKYLSAFPALAKRINAAIDKTVGAAKSAVNAVADKLKAGVEALANALGKALDKILSTFQTALKATVQIAGAVLTGDFAEAAKIAFMAAVEIAGINPQPILNFIERAGNQLAKIFKAPVAFFKNVVSGVKAGVNRFRQNIKKHLIGGLIGWLTGALSEGGITLPEKFDLKGVFSLVMQILGLTLERIKAKVMKKLGPRAETVFERLKQVYSIVSDLVTKGPIALWTRIKEYVTDLKQTVITGIRNWVTKTIIKEGIIWVLSLLNPASAIVKALKLLYDVVMFFVERYQQIVEFAKSVFNSVAELAAGQIGKAAAAVENALARSVPVIISFLASLIGLGGIGSTIRNIISKVRRPIDMAINRVVGWIVSKGKALLKGGRALLAKGKAAIKKRLGGRRDKAQKPSKAVTPADERRHRTYARQILDRLKTPPDNVTSFDEFVRRRQKQAAALEKTYRAKLKKNVKIGVTVGAVDRKNQQFTAKVHIRPNDTTEQERVTSKKSALFGEIAIKDSNGKLIETQSVRGTLKAVVDTVRNMTKKTTSKKTSDDANLAAAVILIRGRPAGRGGKDLGPEKTFTVPIVAHDKPVIFVSALGTLPLDRRKVPATLVGASVTGAKSKTIYQDARQLKPVRSVGSVQVKITADHMVILEAGEKAVADLIKKVSKWLSGQTFQYSEAQHASMYKHSEQAIFVAIMRNDARIAARIRALKLVEIYDAVLHIHTEREMCHACAASGNYLVEHLEKIAKQTHNALQAAKKTVETLRVNVTASFIFRGSVYKLREQIKRLKRRIAEIQGRKAKIDKWKEEKKDFDERIKEAKKQGKPYAALTRSSNARKNWIAEQERILSGHEAKYGSLQKLQSALGALEVLEKDPRITHQKLKKDEPRKPAKDMSHIEALEVLTRSGSLGPKGAYRPLGREDRGDLL